MEKYIPIRKQSLLITYFVFISIVSLILFNDANSIGFGKILIVICVVVTIFQIKNNWEDDASFILLFFSMLNWLYMLPYYFFDIPYHYYMEYQTHYNTNSVVIFQFLFQIIAISKSKLSNHNKFEDIINCKKNDFIFIFNILLLLIMAFISIKGRNLSNYNSYDVDTSSSILFEYCIIVLICARKYAVGLSRVVALFSVGCLFVFLPLFLGKRGPFLMNGICLFFLFFHGKVNRKTLCFGILSVFFLMSLFALLRKSVNDASFIYILLNIGDDGIMSNNQGGVMVSSVAYFGLIDAGVFDWVFRLKSFVGNIFAVFLPASYNFPETFVNRVALEHTAIPGNGGFPGLYSYLWLGYFGLIIPLLLHLVFKFRVKNEVIFYYFIMVMATFPRWYAYNMFVLLKMGFWLVVYFYILKLLDNGFRFGK